MFAFTPISKRRFFRTSASTPDASETSWPDTTDRAIRRAAWSRGQSERRSAYSRRRTLGVAGTLAMLMIAALSMASPSHVFERAEAAQTADAERTVQTTPTDATLDEA